jgi:hypothetical protein
MGFGQTTTDSTKSFTPNPAVSGAATSNLNYAQNLENTAFQPYGGNQVAQFGDLQQQSLTEAGGPQIGNTISGVMNAGPQSVSPNTISSAMNPYLNQYVNYALAPQIQGQNQQFDAQNQQLNSAATSSGAFGDARAGIQAANLTNQQDLARTGLIGSAYNAAFNTAIGAGAQDVANNLQGQTTNANLANTQQQFALQGANQLQGNIGFQNTLGQQQTAQTQAGLNAQYNQWLMGQQRPYQNIQAVDSAVSSGAQGMPATQTTSSPDNSGYGMLGSLGGTVLGGIFGGPMGASIGGSLGGSLFGGSSGGGGDTSVYGQGGSAYGATPSYQNGGVYPMYADGGEPPVGQASVVGERGPELFVPHEPGTIIPHEAVAAAAQPAGAGGAPGGFSHAFGGKPHVSRPRAMQKKAPMMMPPPPDANSNIGAGAFGAAA